MRTFGKMKKDIKINPDRTYFFNSRDKIYDLEGFDNFTDAQNILIARNVFEKKGGYAYILPLKGQSIIDLQESGLKLKKGSLTKRIEEGYL